MHVTGESLPSHIIYQLLDSPKNRMRRVTHPRRTTHSLVFLPGEFRTPLCGATSKIYISKGRQLSVQRWYNILRLRSEDFIIIIYAYERFEEMFASHVIGGGHVQRRSRSALNSKFLFLSAYCGQHRPLPFGMTSGILRLQSASIV